VRVLFFPRSRRLDVWCRASRVQEAVVGGFFVRDPYRPLGEVWVEGRAIRHEPAPAPFAQRRACVVRDGDGVRILAREDVADGVRGDLVQAGPLLVADGAVAFDPEADHEGFSAGAEQFDSDITAERHPRAALGVSDDALVVVACDGRRSRVDAGLSMLELAGIMVDLGAERAINLDGGGSTTLVHRGHLLNRPYSDQDQPAPQTRRVVTALAFEPR
jgi:exopolysaccharide biosynthesis protein